jgi:hypothetical protein
MIKSTSLVVAALGAAYVLSAGGVAAVAQTTPSPAMSAKAPGMPSAGSAQPAGSAQGSDQDDGDEGRAPVLRVISVEVLRSTHGPELDIIRARGLTSTGGWDEAELVPLTQGMPADGILDLMFVARPPSAAAEASGFTPVEAIFPIESGHPFKGVRVHGAANPVTLKGLPGYAEGPPPPAEDCSKCMGKYLVAKGAALPPGKSEADVVREEHLPATLRVIKATDGIAKLDSDPNRLTLVVGEDGQIV